MKTAERPENESERLRALHEYRILGTSPEQSYDDITKIASEICQTPIALISLVDADRQWFKSRVGLEAEQTSRDWSFCAHAILSPEPLIVRDALSDERFRDNPLVTGEPEIRLYAGFPLQNHQDHRIGTLCVIDRKPKDLTPSQCTVMEALARQAVSFLELRKRSIKLLESVCTIQGNSGMISTCSYCRKVKDDRGHWLYLDQYLSQRSNLSFSHGICDSCMRDHFPEVVEVWESEKENEDCDE
ncbi:MAG: diguanylate cyclase [Cyanobium sp. NAT70]|nr:diguanylate cyclase [Cyanobium sp. NAT70]